MKTEQIIALLIITCIPLKSYADDTSLEGKLSPALLFLMYYDDKSTVVKAINESGKVTVVDETSVRLDFGLEAHIAYGKNTYYPSGRLSGRVAVGPFIALSSPNLDTAMGGMGFLIKFQKQSDSENPTPIAFNIGYGLGFDRNFKLLIERYIRGEDVMNDNIKIGDDIPLRKETVYGHLLMFSFNIGY